MLTKSEIRRIKNLFLQQIDRYAEEDVIRDNGDIEEFAKEVEKRVLEKALTKALRDPAAVKQNIQQNKEIKCRISAKEQEKIDNIIEDIRGHLEKGWEIQCTLIAP